MNNYLVEGSPPIPLNKAMHEEKNWDKELSLRQKNAKLS